MSQYMHSFARELRLVDLRLCVGVRRIRWDAGFIVEDDHGREARFDQRVLATSSRDAASLLAELPRAADLMKETMPG